jgi:acyl carrier protein
MESDPAQLMRELSGLIRDTLLIDVTSPDQDLLSSGVVDSLTLVQLLLVLESHFGVAIPLEELEIDDFRTLGSIARLIQIRTALLHADGTPAAKTAPQPSGAEERRPAAPVYTTPAVGSAGRS